MKKLLITLLFLMPFISKAQFTYDVSVNSFVMNIVGVTDLSMNVTSTNYGYAVWGQDIRFDGFTTSTIKFHPDQIRNINGATVPQPTTATRIVEILDSVIAALPTGSATDTTSLSARINTKLNITDTANIRPQLYAGSNISITGTYPNLTIAASGGGGAYDSTLMATQYRLDTVKAKMVRITDIGSTVQAYNANTTTLGNTTSGTGSTILLSGSPAITTPSIAAITVSGGTLTLPTGSSATLMRTSDTTGKFVTGAYRKTASDSVFVIRGGAGVFAFRDSIGSGGGGGLDSSVFRRLYLPNALSSTAQSVTDQASNASTLQLSTTTVNVNAPTLTGSSATSAFSISQIWNTTGNPTAFLLNVTNTASGSTSYLFDFQLSSTSFLRLTKSGVLNFGNSVTGGINFGSANIGVFYASSNTANIIYSSFSSHTFRVYNGSTYAQRAFLDNTGYYVGTGTIKASAALEVESTTQGFLPPRMTATQASAISSPAEGLMLYVTDTNGTFTAKGWWGYNGSAWEKLNN